MVTMPQAQKTNLLNQLNKSIEEVANNLSLMTHQKLSLALSALVASVVKNTWRDITDLFTPTRSHSSVTSAERNSLDPITWLNTNVHTDLDQSSWAFSTPMCCHYMLQHTMLILTIWDTCFIMLPWTLLKDSPHHLNHHTLIQICPNPRTRKGSDLINRIMSIGVGLAFTLELRNHHEPPCHPNVVTKPGVAIKSPLHKLHLSVEWLVQTSFTTLTLSYHSTKNQAFDSSLVFKMYDKRSSCSIFTSFLLVAYEDLIQSMYFTITLYHYRRKVKNLTDLRGYLQCLPKVASCLFG